MIIVISNDTCSKQSCYWYYIQKHDTSDITSNVYTLYDNFSCTYKTWSVYLFTLYFNIIAGLFIFLVHLKWNKTMWW